MGSFSLELGLFLFLVTLIAEAAYVSIPLIFETTWLSAGYQLSQGVLPPQDLLLMLLSAQLGRQAGAFILYTLSRRGAPFVTKIMERQLGRRRTEGGFTGRLLSRLDTVSPFAVALGRILWLRFPLTILLGARGRLKTLSLGIVIGGIIYDGIYVGLGVLAGKTALPATPFVILYFVGALVALYVLVTAGRFAFRRIKAARSTR